MQDRRALDAGVSMVCHWHTETLIYAPFGRRAAFGWTGFTLSLQKW